MGGAGPDRNFQKCEICTHEPSLFPRQTRHWCFEPERLWAKYSTASQWEKTIFEEVLQSLCIYFLLANQGSIIRTATHLVLNPFEPICSPTSCPPGQDPHIIDPAGQTVTMDKRFPKIWSAFGPPG